MPKVLRLVLLVAGAIVAFVVMRPHAGALLDALRQVGPRFVGIQLASALVFLLDALGWRLAFVLGQAPVGFLRLFNIRMAGEALNRITPIASMGGEPVKAMLLTRATGHAYGNLASVAIAKNTMTLAQISFIFTGIVFALIARPDRSALLLWLGAFPGLVLTAMLVTAVLDTMFRRARRSSDSAAGGAGDRWRAVRVRVLSVWSEVADFYWNQPLAFLLSFLAFYLGWAAGAIELYLTVRALGFELDWREAFAAEALITSVTMATFFIPANVGSQEGGFALLSHLYALSEPVTLAMAVVRRCRETVWVLYGLVCLFLMEGRILLTAESLRPMGSRPDVERLEPRENPSVAEPTPASAPTPAR